MQPPQGKQRLEIRAAQPSDLDRVNQVIEACVMGWDLPDRVKRLSLSSYRYHAHDFAHLDIVVAESPPGEVVGVAAWEPAAAGDLPEGRKGLLLHGLYVSPTRQGGGIGQRLVREALDAASSLGMDGLLVKAQAGAGGYFKSQGFVELPVESHKDYPHRYWKAVSWWAAW